jgi:hypothetical protein
MRAYIDVVLDAVAALLETARRFGIDPDEAKISRFAAMAMFRDADSQQLQARSEEIRAVVSAYIATLALIDSAEPTDCRGSITYLQF